MADGIKTNAGVGANAGMLECWDAGIRTGDQRSEARCQPKTDVGCQLLSDSSWIVLIV